jgi:hypothetical protein
MYFSIVTKRRFAFFLLFLIILALFPPIFLYFSNVSPLPKSPILLILTPPKIKSGLALLHKAAHKR